MTQQPPRTLQRNAADPKQIRHAERKERQRAERFAAALKAVMGTTTGRSVMWELLGLAGVYRTAFDPSGSKTYYNIGRQDFGRELMALCVAADEEAYLLMEREQRLLDHSDQREAEAVRTPAAGEES